MIQSSREVGARLVGHTCRALRASTKAKAKALLDRASDASDPLPAIASNCTHSWLTMPVRSAISRSGNGLLAQLDRAMDFDSIGWGFESLGGRHSRQPTHHRLPTCRAVSRAFFHPFSTQPQPFRPSRVFHPTTRTGVAHGYLDKRSAHRPYRDGHRSIWHRDRGAHGHRDLGPRSPPGRLQRPPQVGIFC